MVSILVILMDMSVVLPSLKLSETISNVHLFLVTSFRWSFITSRSKKKSEKTHALSWNSYHLFTNSIDCWDVLAQTGTTSNISNEYWRMKNALLKGRLRATGSYFNIAMRECLETSLDSPGSLLEAGAFDISSVTASWFVQHWDNEVHNWTFFIDGIDLSQTFLSPLSLSAREQAHVVCRQTQMWAR